MPAIYFPQTLVTPEAAAALGRRFPALAAYRPGDGEPPAEMAALAASGAWQFVAGPPGSAARLAAAAAEFRRFGELHREGAGLRALAALGGALARDTESEPRILEELRRRLLPTGGGEREESLFAARLTLHLAEEFDRGLQAIATDLARHRELSAALVEALGAEPLAEEGAADPLAAAEIDLGADDDLTRRRLEAWARIFLSSPLPGPLWATCDPRAVAALLEALPPASILAAELAAVFAGGDPEPRLERIASAPEGELRRTFGFGEAGAVAPPSGAGPDCLYAFLGHPPARLGRILAGMPPEAAAATGDPGPHHTLVAFVALAGER